MFDIGFLELMVVAILGLLVLGPERLPGAARSVGLVVGRFRRTVNNFQDELERQVRAEELKEKLKDPYATFNDIEVPVIRKPENDASVTTKPAAAEPVANEAASTGSTATRSTTDTDKPVAGDRAS